MDLNKFIEKTCGLDFPEKVVEGKIPEFGLDKQDDEVAIIQKLTEKEEQEIDLLIEEALSRGIDIEEAAKKKGKKLKKGVKDKFDKKKKEKEEKEEKDKKKAKDKEAADKKKEKKKVKEGKVNEETNSFEIFFHDLSDEAQKRYLEFVGNPDDENLELSPLAIVDLEQSGEEEEDLGRSSDATGDVRQREEDEESEK